MNNGQELRDFLLDNKERMTIDLVARVLNGVYDDTEVNILIERLEATRGKGYLGIDDE